MLASARASENELTSVTQTVELPKKPNVTVKKTPKTATVDENWKDEDVKYVRPKPVSSPPVASVPPINNSYSSSSRVYVRGYYRKNGTYVRPHSRRK
jgi:hypothetical protein